MRYNKSAKIMSLIGLTVTLFCVTVAYSALGASLKVSGSGSVTNAGWDVHFASAKVTPPGSADCGTPSISNGSTLNIAATLKAATDKCTYTFDVVNGGGIDAKITAITMPNAAGNSITCEGLNSGANASTNATKLCSNLNFALNYTGDSGTGTVNVNDQINGKITKHMALVVSFKSTTTNIPDDDVRAKNIKLTMAFNQTT